MNLKKTNLNKYLLASGAILLGATNVNADIIYTDINPDSSLLGNNNNTDEFFSIDINNDGQSDFIVGMKNIDTVLTGLPFNGIKDYYFNAAWVSADTLSPNNAVINASSSYYNSDDKYFALALSSGSIISPNDSFKDWGYVGLNSSWAFTSDYWSGAGGRGSVGSFQNLTKYVGVKFGADSNNMNYGWILFDVDSLTHGVKVLDYAYQDCPNVQIKAGDMTSVGANTLALSINEFNAGETPEDIEFSFNLSEVDTTVSEYRLMIVKTDKASSFTKNDAKLIADSLVLTLSNSTFNYLDTLSTDVLDTDGDPIQYGFEGYKMFALSIPDGKNTNSIALSDASDTFLKMNLSIEGELENITINYSNNQIIINSDDNLDAFLSILSLDGKLIVSEKIDNKNHSVNTNHYPKGIYVVNVISRNGRFFQKIVL